MKFGHLDSEGNLVYAKQPVFIPGEYTIQPDSYVDEETGETITPEPIVMNGRKVFTSDPALMLQGGEKELVETAYPEDGKNYVASWSEAETQITRVWTEIEPTEEWVDKALFVQAVTALIPEEERSSYASDWRVIAGIAQLPGDRVDLLDPRVSVFTAMVGMTVDQIRNKMQELATTAESGE